MVKRNSRTIFPSIKYVMLNVFHRENIFTPNCMLNQFFLFGKEKLFHGNMFLNE